MQQYKRRLKPLWVLSCTLLVVTLAACTTTTRSVNESPRDPRVQRQVGSTTPQANQRSTRQAQASRRERQERPARRLASRQLDQLTLHQLETMLLRGQTSADQVAALFGRPHSTTRSGDEIYWNYTHQFRDERRNLGGLKSLTILFDEYGRVSDYDFQDNSFNLQ